MTTNQTPAVVAALKSAPCSVRKLALAAGVPQSTLAFILYGRREATPAVAGAVATALERWSADCAKAARRIRQAKRTTTNRGRRE